MSEEIEIINLYVNRNASYSLNLNNVQDISNTRINFSILSNNLYLDTGEPIIKLNNNILIPWNEGICDIRGITDPTNLYNQGLSNKKRIIISKNNQIPFTLNSLNPIYFLDTVNFQLQGGSIDSNPIILTCNSYLFPKLLEKYDSYHVDFTLSNKDLFNSLDEQTSLLFP